MIFHQTRAPKTQIWPVSSFLFFFFQPNFTFSIVFSTFYPLDGFLAPWDPSQKKDLIFLRRMVPLRPLYDEIWPDSGQFKVPNFIHMYTHMYIHMYIHMYLHMYIRNAKTSKERAQKVIPGGAKTNENFWKCQDEVQKSILCFPSFFPL